MQPPKLSLSPPRARVLRRPVWFLCALAWLSLSVFVAIEMARQVVAKQTQTFSGVLESQRTQVPLVLPAHVPLQTMLVAEGDHVTAGQKLARLDQASLRQLYQEASAALSLKEVERSCLQTALYSQLQRPMAVSQAATPGHSHLSDEYHNPAKLKDRVVDRCEGKKRSDLIAQQRLLQKRDSLKRQSLLAVEELVARAETTSPAVQKVLKIRAALERETLQSAIREIEFDIAQLKQSTRSKRQDALALLDAEITHLKTRQAYVKTLLSAPWLHAPAAGKLTHLRSLRAGSSSPEDQILARIQQGDTNDHVAYFDMPAAQAKLLPSGMPVLVSIAGFSLYDRQTEGQIIRTLYNGDVTGSTARVFVALPPERFEDTFSATLLETAKGTRSTLHVTLGQRSLAEVLRQAATSTFTATGLLSSL